jgi:uncharacterized protein (DUF2384 family)
MTDPFHKETLNRLVVSLVGGDKLSKDWWKSPNRAFEDRTPESLMNEEEWTRVRDYLFNHAYGGAYG